MCILDTPTRHLGFSEQSSIADHVVPKGITCHLSHSMSIVVCHNGRDLVIVPREPSRASEKPYYFVYAYHARNIWFIHDECCCDTKRDQTSMVIVILRS